MRHCVHRNAPKRVVRLLGLVCWFVVAIGIGDASSSDSGNLGRGKGSTVNAGSALPATRESGPTGADVVSFSGGMFPRILNAPPNFSSDFIYSFGPNLRHGRLTADYVLPIPTAGGVFFGEAHADFQDFWKVYAPSGAKGSVGTIIRKRTDLSLGGGYRRRLGDVNYFGANAFFDATNLRGKWYTSGGVGLEFAYSLPGDGLVDLNFNYYGALFSLDQLIRTFRYGSGTFDAELGYAQPLFNRSLDLRLKATAYRFDIGTPVYGRSVGADLTGANGLLKGSYSYNRDGFVGDYHSVGVSLNIGFQAEALLRGDNPFSMPEPVYGSPRNLRRNLTERVKRNRQLPEPVVVARSAGSSEPSGPPTITRFYAHTLPGAPVTIPEAGTINCGSPGGFITDSITVPAGDAGGPTFITNVVVTVFMTHTYAGDIRIELQPPAPAPPIVLKASGCVASGGTFAGCPSLISSVIQFSDSGAQSISVCDQSPGVYPNPVDGANPSRPATPLVLLNGFSAVGDWTLRVQDQVILNVGAITGWQLELTGTNQ